MKSTASYEVLRPRRRAGVAEFVNTIEGQIFSFFRFSALGLAVGDPSLLGFEDREQQQAGALGRQHAGRGDGLGISCGA